MTKRELEFVLLAIESIATRRHRGASDRKSLLRDLDLIAKRAARAVGAIPVSLTLGHDRDQLAKIRAILEGVDQRAGAVDGPVTPTNEEITLEELRQIYRLTKP